MKAEVLRSGPISTLKIDCSGCPRLSSLLDPACRRCILRHLSRIEPVQRVELRRAFSRVYITSRLSQLAHAIVASDLPEDRKERVMEMPHETKLLERLGLHEVKALIEQWELHPKNYEEVFACSILPFFVRAVWVGSKHPKRLVDAYPLEGGGEVRIYEQLGTSTYFYDLDLPEFKLDPGLVSLMFAAYRQPVREVPAEVDVSKPEEVSNFLEREYIRRMLGLGGNRLGREQLAQLSRLLVRWSKYGLLEPLSRDDNLTDIHLEPPVDLQPVMVEHVRWGKCQTGFCISTLELERLAGRLAALEDKRFDEQHPHLDAELGELGLRFFFARTPQLSASVRKRRRKPWTQPLFIQLGTLTPLAGSFLSTLLRLGFGVVVLGAIGTAKTSQVETYIPEIGRSERIVTFQDTEELHVPDFVRLGYRLTSVRVQEPAEMQRVIESFLRGGTAHWIFTEVRHRESIKPAIGAAARQGQPVILSMHARSEEELMVILTKQMGLSGAELDFLDLMVTCARFETPRGTVRRVTSISEVRGGGSTPVFSYDRKADRLENRIFRGDPQQLRLLDSMEVSKLGPQEMRGLFLRPPEEGGSALLQLACRKLGLDEGELIQRLLQEAQMKSLLVKLAEAKPQLLELPSVTQAYDYYSFLIRSEEVDPLSKWKEKIDELV